MGGPSTDDVLTPCERAVEAMRPSISAELLRVVRAYGDGSAGWGVAIGVLIDELVEEEIRPSREQARLLFEALASVGQGEGDRADDLRDLGELP